MSKIIITFAEQNNNTMSNKNIDPQKVKYWLGVIIAVLSAIAGAIAESKTAIAASLLQ